MGGLVDVLRAHVARPLEASDDELAPLLDEVVRAGASAWPDVKLAPEAFVARLAHHCAPDPCAWLREVRAAELYLASACAARIPGAIETLEREHLVHLPAILAKGGMRDAPVDEIRQRLYEKLFVGAARIGDYSGRGPLGAWLQVVTLRIGIDVARQQRSQPIAASPEELDDVRLVGTDPELRLIKERFRGPFKLALRAAIRELSPEQRGLLKQHFIDGATLDELGRQLGVHRATVARRIAQARDEVFDGVRARLQAELGIARAEFDELVGLLRSRLELSLSALVEA